MRRRESQDRDMDMARGLASGETLAAVGARFGVSKQRVHQIVETYLGELIERKPKPKGLATIIYRNHQSKTYIYVIQASNGWVKIGHSTNVESRLNTINLHSPLPVRLIAKFTGRMRDEQHFHRMFEAERDHSEWFRNEGGMLRFIDDVFGLGLSEGVAGWNSAQSNRLTSEKRIADGIAKRAIAMRLRWADPAWKADQLMRLKRGKDSHRCSYALLAAIPATSPPEAA